MDVKPANIFLKKRTDTSPVMAKLGDFGISVVVKKDLPPTPVSSIPRDYSTLGHASTNGDERYIPLERLQKVKPHPSMDMFSLGLILYEMVTNFSPPAKPTVPSWLEIRIGEPII